MGNCRATTFEHPFQRAGAVTATRGPRSCFVGAPGSGTTPGPLIRFSGRKVVEAMDQTGWILRDPRVGLGSSLQAGAATLIVPPYVLSKFELLFMNYQR